MRLLLPLFLCFFALGIQAQIPPLERTLSLKVENEPVSVVLDRIGQLTKVNFSYNPEAIEGAKNISLTVNNRTVREVLNLVFRGSVRYKVTGEYIILTRAPQSDEALARKGGDFWLSGYVVDEATGTRIPRASIYDRTSLASAVSDAEGFYKIRLPADRGAINLSVSKQAYQRQQIAVSPSAAEAYADVRIRAIPTEQVKAAQLKLDSATQPKIEYEPLARFFVPDEQLIHSENLVERIGRVAQVSLLPSIGTNRLLGGSTGNKFSLNILAGYADEVKAVEVGGLANIVRENVRYVQVGGLFNLVGGNTQGVQVAGLANLNRQNVAGVQVAGLFNMVRGRSNGAQIAGLFNFNWAQTGPWQVAGLLNFSKDTLRGVQMAGLLNFNWKRVYGWQVGGLFNVAVAGISGVQTAGLFNVAGQVRNGGQIAPFLNLAWHGVQNGGQLGLVNYATKVRKGFQIGLVNYADSVSSSGVQLGLFSFVRRGGYKRLEASTNDVTRVNVTLRTGVKWFYNIFQVGSNIADTARIQLIGYGFGSGMYLSKKQQVMLNVEGTGYWAFSARIEDDNEFFRELNSQLFRVGLSIEYKLGKHVSVAAGPVYNWAFLERGRLSSLQRIVPTGGDISEAGPHDLKRWLGFQAGIRLF
jgi:Secretin and TonB N terminus short domain